LPRLSGHHGHGAVRRPEAFTAAIIGSFESLPGAIIGGLSVGVIENLASAYISSAYKDVTAFVILLIVLIVKPEDFWERGG